MVLANRYQRIFMSKGLIARRLLFYTRMSALLEFLIVFLIAGLVWLRFSGI